MVVYNKFGVMGIYRMDNLKALRKKHGYTIYEMAKKLGITASFYSQIENKKRRLFYDSAVKIAAIFNMHPDDIFYTESSDKIDE